MRAEARAYHTEGEDRAGRWLITVDHATNRVPDCVAGGDLGLPAADMARHIAYDLGALGVALAMGRALDGAVVWSDVSRLVIDPNRGEDDPTLVMRLYDGTIIPANRAAGAAEVERRLALFHRPYHAAIARLAARPGTRLVAMHSFTPKLRGRPARPWHVGVLHSEDDRLALPLLRALRAEDELCVGANEPYAGRMPGDSMDRHGHGPGRPHVLLEVRNDLIRTPEAQAAWGLRLARALEAAADAAGI